MHKQNIFNSLKNRWVLQLHQEYENICFEYNLKLKKPLLVIEETKNSWGYWDQNRRTILISEKLILNYSWEVVLSVLKHEMAHQIVSDIYGREEGHGPYFKKACSLIGLDTEYSSATLSMEEPFVHWKHKKVPQEEEALMIKIQKLLNLAGSTHENEAAVAMERVQELYEKYNIQKIKQGESQNFFSLIINFKKKRIPITHCLACFILQQHFFVNTLLSFMYDPMEDTTHKTIEVMGTKQNVLMAEYVFHFLIERIEILWNKYSKENKLNAKFKLSFQRGILDGFLKKLDSSKKIRHKDTNPLQSNDTDLIIMSQAKLNEYVQFKHPKVLKNNRSSGGVYSEHFQHGVKEGEKINLNQPLNKSSENSGPLLLN